MTERWFAKAVSARADGPLIFYGDHLAELSAIRTQAEALTAALEPSAETKAAYMGEFSFDRTYVNDAGNELTESITVPWTTIKEIMAAIRSLACKGSGE